MASLNKVILIGHLTADPELKQTATGVNVTTFSIGVTRKFTKQGEQPQSDFISIVAWRQLADFITKYFHKGNAICICGSIQTRTWTDQNNVKRYSTEVVADEATFVEKKSDRAPDEAGMAPSFSSSPADMPKFEEISGDDNLPF